MANLLLGQIMAERKDETELGLLIARLIDGAIFRGWICLIRRFLFFLFTCGSYLDTSDKEISWL